MTLTRKLMLGMAVLIGGFAVMTVIGGSIEAATTSSEGNLNWEMRVGGAPEVAVAAPDTCESSTIFNAPMALTAAEVDAPGLFGGASPESGGPCQTVVECTLTHWGWYCVVYIVCP
ncbi:MAG: hypothetical protein F4209_11775 [Chloroflexi bacterium]|nr:hypothetical protein [Chloroflexota bacterium]MYF23401.1 hypothetical protein [Chloroflexota bacterium]